MTIKQILRQYWEEFATPTFGVPCTVVSVDLVNQTCVCAPIDGDTSFPEVRYHIGVNATSGVSDGNSIVIIPAVRSMVMVQPMNENTGYISMFSKFQTIQMGDGSRGGLVDTGLLKTQLDKTNKVLNDLVSALTSWTVSPGDGGAALKAAVIAALGTDTTGNFGSISNPNITHGNP